jgi:hypothetical protein
VSVQPYTSPEAPPPSTSSSSGAPIPANAEVPDLAMVWGTAPGFSALGSGGSASSSSTPPVASDLSIDLGSLLDGENSMLSASSTIVAAYESLKQQFQSGEDSVFGQGAKTYTSVATGVSQDPVATHSQADPIQSMAQAFANGQNGQPGMNDVEAYALQQIGNAMALVGEFIALMNSSGNSYATADTNSEVPSASGSSS